jgi:GNAT superfamily N-acetyltransferase
MSRFQIVPFDVDTTSRETWTAFHAHRRVIAAELHPDDPILSDEECEYQMRRADSLWAARRWAAFDGPRVIGFAGAWFRRPGTPNADEHARFLNCYGDVAAATRRKGIGTLLLQEVQALMHALDKSMLTLSTHIDSGHGFLTHVGATAKHSMLECRTLLDELDWPDLRSWEGIAADFGLVWECYAGRVPREVLMPLLPALTALVSEVPLGALDTPPIRLEIEAYDRWYETMERTEGAHHLILLREPGGAVIAMSEASWDNRNPKIAYQRFTAIAKSWRCRGLARAVKATILRQIRASHPGVKEMRTANAESNAAILSVNRRFGFSVRHRHVDYQITRTQLDARDWTRRTE